VKGEVYNDVFVGVYSDEKVILL